jgi:protein SCO1/2
MGASNNMKFKVAATAAIVILPIFAVFFWSKAKWVHKELPIFGDTIMGDNGIKEFFSHTVSDIVLYNQHGKKITLDDFDSSILVVNIFFASCPTICPSMNKQIQSVAEGYINENNIKFLTVTIDPESDSVPVLAEYAKAYKADLYKRTFATGNKREIYDWVFNDLKLATEQRGSNFIHDDKVVIIDKQHRIRAILPTSGENNTQKFKNIQRIKDDIENLKYEYRQKELDK